MYKNLVGCCPLTTPNEKIEGVVLDNTLREVR